MGAHPRLTPAAGLTGIDFAPLPDRIEARDEGVEGDVEAFLKVVRSAESGVDGPAAMQKFPTQ
jgi:hypothetical protein